MAEICCTEVGLAWMQGRFQVFEEHRYTECVTGVLRNALAAIALPDLIAGWRQLALAGAAQPRGD